MAAVTDINKSSIMKMLRQDVFGFTPAAIEEQAKVLHDFVINGEKPKLKQVGGYGRNENGFIHVFMNAAFFEQKDEKPAAKKKSTKKK